LDHAANSFTLGCEKVFAINQFEMHSMI